MEITYDNGGGAGLFFGVIFLIVLAVVGVVIFFAVIDTSDSMTQGYDADYYRNCMDDAPSFLKIIVMFDKDTFMKFCETGSRDTILGQSLKRQEDGTYKEEYIKKFVFFRKLDNVWKWLQRLGYTTVKELP